MKENLLRKIKMKIWWKIYKIKYYVNSAYYTIIGYMIYKRSIYDERWYKINYKCYGVDKNEKSPEYIYTSYISKGTIFKPSFLWIGESSCKKDAIVKCKSAIKGKYIETKCKNKLMFSNHNTSDFHSLLMNDADNK